MRQISSGCLWISTVANIYSAGSVTPFEQSDSFFEMLCSLLAAHYTTAQARRTPGPLDQLSARERGTCEGILCGLKPEA